MFVKKKNEIIIITIIIIKYSTNDQHQFAFLSSVNGTKSLKLGELLGSFVQYPVHMRTTTSNDALFQD